MKTRKQKALQFIYTTFEAGESLADAARFIASWFLLTVREDQEVQAAIRELTA